MPAPASNPVIFVPGITASYLRDDYPLPPQIVWSVMKKKYERIALHPDNPKYEAVEPARVVADQVFEISYEDMIEELRYNLSSSEDNPIPVYPFGYDWRQPLNILEEQLSDFIEEVIDRTKLMRNYHPGFAKNPKVNLIGHSMGGLVVAGYIEKYGDKRRIGKVTTLAAPFQGSHEAVIKMATGTANLGVKAPSSREREAARLTPALYHLIPSFKKGLQIDKPFPQTLFKPDTWQKSIPDTITEYVKLHGVKAKTAQDIRKQADALFSSLLSTAQKHRKRLNRADLLEASGLSSKDWLCVVGVDATTRVNLRVVKDGKNPAFSLNSSDRMNDWDDPDGDPRNTGDGTVPFEGAIPKFLPYESLICVSPDDYGYWEIGDKLTTKIGGFHGILPNMNMLHRLIVRHFTGRPGRSGNTWGRIPPGVSEKDWRKQIPIKDLRVKE